MSSNFEKVGEFHSKFGVQQQTNVYHTVFNENPKLLNFRISLIEEEFTELKESIKSKDMVETVDALADILYVVYGMGQVLGLNLDRAFDIVHDSNMSKLCDSESQAIETCEWIKTCNHDYSPGYRQLECGSFLVYDTLSGKVLKSKYYKPAIFDELLK